MEPVTLHPHHRAMLERDSGLSPEVIEARGYRTVTVKSELKRLEFGEAQRLVPALLIPILTVHGDVGTHQLRPDQARICKGKVIKYETPKGSRMVLDCHPFARPDLGNPGIPLFVTEGAKKADALISRGCCALALLGVWNWRGTNSEGGKTALADWECVALNERTVYVVFDNDVMTKPAVHEAMTRFGAFLESRKATVRYVYIPYEESGAKMGVDDFLVAGHSINDLIALSSSTLRLLPPTGDERQGTSPYAATEQGLVLMTSDPPKRLSNFTARVTADIKEHDGVESIHRVEVEATLRGQRTTVGLTAQEFQAMAWPIERLGSGAIVYPGMGHGIMPEPPSRCSRRTLRPASSIHISRWRDLANGVGYLHAKGAIGSLGPLLDVEVSVQGELQRYALPAHLKARH